MKNKVLKLNSAIYLEIFIGVCLAIVGGFLDAYTYIFRGGVFVNAQTGNMVLFGIFVANGSFIEACYYLIPIFAFALGVFVSEYLKRHTSNNQFFNWLNITIVIEAVILIVVGFLNKDISNTYINVTVSFVCSLQVNAFRTIASLPYATTMCTGNLRSATEQISMYLFDKNKQAGINCLIYLLIILCFCIGAVIGAIFTNMLNEKAVWLCSAALFMVLALMHIKRKNTGV